MPDVKPTPARMVLYFPAGVPKPWPAVVVEVFDKNGKISCDLRVFATRGHGEISMVESVPFSDKPGEKGTCSFPVILTSVPPAPPAPINSTTIGTVNGSVKE